MHGAAFLAFPFSGDKERLEICSQSLAASRGHQRGPPRAGEMGEGSVGVSQGTAEMSQGCGEPWWGLGTSTDSAPCELWPAPSFPPCCLRRAEGGKGELGGEGQVGHLKVIPPKQAQTPPSPMA